MMVEHGAEPGRRLLEPAEAIETLRSLDWDVVDADTSHSGHAIHPYPAKFPPQLPFQLVEVLTVPGDFVVDCFGGSGTTALEAVRLGRRAASIDANQVGLNVARVKLEADKRVGEDLLALADDLQRGQAFSAGGCGCDDRHWRPKIPNVDKWYAPFVIVAADVGSRLRSPVPRQHSGEVNGEVRLE